MERLYLLDYGAGNVRSLLNAVQQLGYEVTVVQDPSDLAKADKLLFPGVGDFGHAMDALKSRGLIEPLKEYLSSGKPMLAICVGMQVLFEGSSESPSAQGLGILPGICKRFEPVDDMCASGRKSVPHMGWNGVVARKQVDDESKAAWNGLSNISSSEPFYFVHSYAVPLDINACQNMDYVIGVSRYGSEYFVSAVARNNLIATQFHPEKSGQAGLDLLKAFLESNSNSTGQPIVKPGSFTLDQLVDLKDSLSLRVVACLDVRTNDDGDLVVTKGDQYDVRERSTTEKGQVRNLGKPVDLAARYFHEGADEIAFLNIMSFKGTIPLYDMPMLHVLREASKRVFVPLTIGGGIRECINPENNQIISAIDVVGEYFRSGADKVSIGSDAVRAAEAYVANGCKPTGTSAIEAIAKRYGVQAVVVSIDPKRVYVASPEDAPEHARAKGVIPTSQPGPNGEGYCWFQCTVSGGREVRPMDAITLASAVEALGAGEILLNSIDRDGTKSGFDTELIAAVKKAVSIPVVASSGAGRVEHFSEVVRKAGADAVLAAGIFHRREVPLEDVKQHLRDEGVPVRISSSK
ncbi:imidazole glycerol phosphate synthase HisHF [Ramicandelaber brevisporus]|nr:imidazole glycerol phosphate synthase HisHF [Ramicandelaber brevisporus]